MSRNELRQLALDLRKQNPEFQVLHSQVAQQVAERFYQARERFLEGLANKPKKKKPHKFLSLVYPQSGWRLSNTRDVGQGKSKKKKARLYLSKIGFFTLILHREFPENQVSQVCVKLNPSGRIHVSWWRRLKHWGNHRRSPRTLWVSTWGSRGLQHFQMGAFSKTQNRLSALLKESGCYKGHFQEKGFFRITGLKQRLAKEHEHLKDFRRDSLNSGLFFHRSTTS
jgi:putative transposase